MTTNFSNSFSSRLKLRLVYFAVLGLFHLAPTEPIEGLTNLTKYDAKAVEQVLIEMNGLEKNGGTLMNKINSIAKTNPEYAESLKRGVEILQEAGQSIE